MNYKQIGDLGQNCVIGHLAKYGLGIAYPLSDNYPFDFIIIAGCKLFRTQVKSTTERYTDSFIFRLTTNNFSSGEIKGYNAKDIDIIACYSIITDIVYLLGPETFEGQKSINIRSAPAKNDQEKNVHFHDKYILSKKRIKELLGFDAPDFTEYYSQINIASRQKSTYKHICEVCHTSFSSGSKKSKFCSVICQKMASRKVTWPSPDELQNMIDTMPWTQIAAKYEVTDNAVRRWARHYDIKKKV